MLFQVSFLHTEIMLDIVIQLGFMTRKLTVNNPRSDLTATVELGLTI